MNDKRVDPETGERQRFSSAILPATIEALRNLVDRLDNAMPNLVDDAALRKKVIDSIGDYCEQLAMTTNEFLRRVVAGDRWPR